MPIPVPPWGQAAVWEEANFTLAEFIRQNRPYLRRAEAATRQLAQQLHGLYPLLDGLCRSTCRYCPDPCCLRALVWFDFGDLIFMHLQGLTIPEGQLISRSGETCRYCGPRGCRLPRLKRPWICIWYLCPAQSARLRMKTVAVRSAHARHVSEVKRLRSAAEAEFLRIAAGSASNTEPGGHLRRL